HPGAGAGYLTGARSRRSPEPDRPGARRQRHPAHAQGGRWRAGTRRPAGHRGRRPGALMAVRMPAWPLTGLLLLYPLWWVLGLGVLIFPIAAVPMAVILLRQRFAGRPIRFPPGFALWLLFLAVVVLGIAALDATPAGTVPAGSGGGKLAGAGYRIGGYLTLTVLLLYAGNLRESELPRRRLVWLLAGLFMVTVAGGLVGTFAGHLELTSP